MSTSVKPRLRYGHNRQKKDIISSEDSAESELLSAACEYTYANSRTYRRWSPSQARCSSPNLKRNAIGNLVGRMLNFSDISCEEGYSKHINGQSRCSQRYGAAKNLDYDFEVSHEFDVPEEARPKSVLFIVYHTLFQTFRISTAAAATVLLILKQIFLYVAHSLINVLRRSKLPNASVSTNHRSSNDVTQSAASEHFTFAETDSRVVRDIKKVTMEEMVYLSDDTSPRASMPIRSLAAGKRTGSFTPNVPLAATRKRWWLWIILLLIPMCFLLFFPWIGFSLVIEKRRTLNDIEMPAITLPVIKDKSSNLHNFTLALLALNRRHELQYAAMQRRISSILQRLSFVEGKSDRMNALEASHEIRFSSFDKILHKLDSQYGIQMDTLQRSFSDQIRQSMHDSVLRIKEDLDILQHKKDAMNDQRFSELHKIADQFSKRACNCTPSAVLDPSQEINISRIVESAIQQAIDMYDADKIGLADYAFEPSGGVIIGTGCTETYKSETRQLSWAWIPLWYIDYPPRSIIQPGPFPGQCWCFKYHLGSVTIQLSRTIHITGWSYEHIHRSVSPNGKIDSAPKYMQLWGMKTRDAEEETLLGNFTYDGEGRALQYFPIQNPRQDAYPIVDLKISKNHGNPLYTCLYRVRIHGTPIDGA